MTLGKGQIKFGLSRVYDDNHYTLEVHSVRMEQYTYGVNQYNMLTIYIISRYCMEPLICFQDAFSQNFKWLHTTFCWASRDSREPFMQI